MLLGDSKELVPEASRAAHLGWTHGPCEGSQGQNGVSGAASTMTDRRGLGRLVWRPQLSDHWGRRVLCPQEGHVVVTWEDISAESTCVDGSTSGRKKPHKQCHASHKERLPVSGADGPGERPVCASLTNEPTFSLCREVKGREESANNSAPQLGRTEG